MDSNYIEETFENYLSTASTNYALLIDGSWGSGKTYFWKNTLAKKCAKKEFKPIYLSLNGINKIEDLKYQFLIKIVPFLNVLDSKTGNIGKTLIATLSSSLGNVDINNLIKDIEVDSKKLNTYVVCLDDLERCSIATPEVLGFINNYVEHKGLKVVILSDESKIDEKEKDKYNNIKEKVIGRVLSYRNNVSKTLPLLFKKYETENTDFYNFLDGQKDFVLDLLKSYQEDNLRKVSFYIDLLHGLYPIIKDFDKFNKEVVMFTLIITLEFKTGKLTSSDYKDYKGYNSLNSTYAAFNFQVPEKKGYLGHFKKDDSEKEEKTESPLEVFYNKYLNDKIDQYFFYPSIYEYVLTGYFDKDRLVDELKKRHPEEVPPETLAYRKIITYRFRHLSNTEFEESFEQVYQLAEEGKYFLYDYLQLSNFFNFFSESKLINFTKSEIQNTLDNGIQISQKRDEINEDLFDSMFVRFGIKDDDQFIAEKIKDAHQIIKAKKETQKGNLLIETINKNDSEELDEIFKRFFFNDKMFQYLTPIGLFDSLKQANNETIDNFNQNLDKRYSSTNVKDYLSNDLPFLQEFNACLNKYLSSKTNTDVNIFLFNELTAKVDSICEKLS